MEGGRDGRPPTRLSFDSAYDSSRSGASSRNSDRICDGSDDDDDAVQHATLAAVSATGDPDDVVLALSQLTHQLAQTARQERYVFHFRRLHVKHQLFLSRAWECDADGAIKSSSNFHPMCSYTFFSFHDGHMLLKS